MVGMLNQQTTSETEYIFNTGVLMCYISKY